MSGYSREELTAQAEEIIRFTTSEPFLRELQAVFDTEKSRQLDAAAEKFAPEHLAGLGLSLPANTRISSRVFDEADGKSIVLGGRDENGYLQDISIPTKPITAADVNAQIRRQEIIQGAITTAGVCVCVGGGACVGVGK